MEEKNNPVDKFFEKSDLTLAKTIDLVTKGLEGADFGEFYQESSDEEQIFKNMEQYDRIIVGNNIKGCGFRAVTGSKSSYYYSCIFNEASLKSAIYETQDQIIFKSKKSLRLEKEQDETINNKEFYPQNTSVDDMTLDQKISKIDEIEEYAKSLDKNITNVKIAFTNKVQNVHIITADGRSLTDTRPSSKLTVELYLKDAKKGKMEIGSGVRWGRASCKDIFEESSYKNTVNQALHIAQELMVANYVPNSENDFEVVMAPGWSAVILHEAVGHGLEGDLNYKNASVYSGKIGKLVAAPEITIIDQGNMPSTRGSLHFDDEGTPTQKNILVENGILKSYMHDIKSARLMGVNSTGNGRRDTFMSVPFPRMTNTYIANGSHNPEDIIKSVKNGIYVYEMSNGEVDISSGDFVMNTTLCYRIRNGKLCEPIKGASVTGNGPEVIKNITMLGNDLQINNNRGICSKYNQDIMIGCGQPTILVKGLTIGRMK